MRFIDTGLLISAVLVVAVGSFGATAMEGCKSNEPKTPTADADACPPAMVGAPAPCASIAWPDTPAGRACASLEAAGCPEARPPGTEGCVGVLDKAVDAGVFNIDPACIARANGDASAVRACGVRCGMK